MSDTDGREARDEDSAVRLIQELADEETFVPLAAVAPGRWAGFATVDGRDVLLLPATGVGGAQQAQAVARVLDLAMGAGRPLVTVYAEPATGPAADPGAPAARATRSGARRSAVRISGAVPQVALVAGGPPEWTDLGVLAADVVISTGRQESLDPVVHYVAEDTDDAVDVVRDVLSFLPSTTAHPAPILEAADPRGRPADDALGGAGPVAVDDLLDALSEDFLELGGHRRGGLVTGFGRLDGRSVGIVADTPQPGVTADQQLRALARATRFVRTCDCFNLPVITIVNGGDLTPRPTGLGSGALGSAALGSAALAHAYGEASVPLLALVTDPLGADGSPLADVLPFADIAVGWPSERIAVEDLVVAAGSVNGAGAAKSGARVSSQEEQDAEREAQHWRRYDDLLRLAVAAGPAQEAVSRGLADAVVDRPLTRQRLADSLRLLAAKVDAGPAVKHANPPL